MNLESPVRSGAFADTLLKQKATFATNNAEEGARHITRSSSHTLKAGARWPFVQLAHWRCSLEHTEINLVELDCGDEFQISTDCASGRYVFQFPLRGSCHFRIGGEGAVAAPGEMFVINPRQTAHKRWVGPCSQLMLQIDRNAFDQLLASELNRVHRAPIQFERLVQNDEVTSALRTMIIQTWHTITLNPLLGQQRIARSIERTLLTTFLSVLRHNYSDELSLIGTPAAPYYVKRAEDYIRAHLRDPIDIKDLVEASGVSSRSLYYGFRRWRGIPPMGYLRNVRLAIAHEELKRARDEASNVTRVALNVGYDHLSRFSKDYKERYGVTPSATLLHTA